VMAGDLSLYRRFRRRFYWVLAVGLLQTADLVPLRCGRALCRQLARLAFRLRRRERELALANLALAFPQMDTAARERLLQASTVALGRTLFDAVAARRILKLPGAVTEGVASDAGEPALGDRLAELAGRGKGVLILTGHLGCWELLGGWLARELERRGLGPLATVTGTVHNPAVDRLLQDRRRELGLIVMPRREGMRPLLRHLRDGGVGAILLDQNLRGQGDPVPFFGVPAPTAPGLARVALRYGTPVVPVAMAWNPVHERHEVVDLPTLDVVGLADDAEGTGTLLARANLALEELIRRNPAEWVWFHDRWHIKDTGPATGE